MNKTFVILVAALLSVVPSLSFAQSTGGGGGGSVCILPTCQTVALSPGWNIVSTPKLLTSHTFSAAETSANFDIFTLDATQPSGWATMASLGQTEFTPLYGYFVNNKTGSHQTLRLNYLASTTPSQRLFGRTFGTPGWYSFGVANPTYTLPIDAATTSTHTANPVGNLVTILGSFDVAVDFTDGAFPQNVQSRSADKAWKAVAFFDLDKLRDFRETKGYAIHVTESGKTLSGFQNDAAAPPVITSPVTISIVNSPGVQSQNIALNVANQVLGGFQTTITGEPISLQNMTFAVATSSTGVGRLTNVLLVDENGSVVAGPVDTSLDGKTIQFNNSITFPTGLHTYTLKGRAPTTFSNGGQITLSTNPSTQWLGAQGQTSGSSISLASNGLFGMNTMTVRAATLSVAASADPASQNIVAGGQNVVLAKLQFDASQSGEDIRVNRVDVAVSSANNVIDPSLSNCQIWDGTTSLTTGSNINNSIVSSTGNGSLESFTLDNSLTVTKGTVKTLALTCSISSSAVPGSTIKFGVDTTVTPYTNGVTGVQSGNSFTPTVSNASFSGLMTISSGASVTVSVDSSSPSYQVAAAGTTGVTLGVFKLRSANENFNLTKLGLTASSTASIALYANQYGSKSTGAGNAATASGDITTVYLYNGATLLGTATFLSGNTVATSTLNSPLVVTRDVDTLITIKADLSAIGGSAPGGIGNIVTVDPLNFEGTGASSGTTVRGYGTGSTAGVRMFKSYPTISLDTLSSSGVADGRLMRFKITAGSAGPVSVGVFKVTTTPSNATLSNIQLFGFTDASYSSAISGQGSGGQIGGTLTFGASPLNFTPNNPVVVPAGSTYYFEVRASVANVVSGSSVVTKLLGDAAYGSTFTSGYNAQTLLQASTTDAKNFVWSGNSTSTATKADVDWSAGYSIPGLPSSGLIQTRSN